MNDVRGYTEGATPHERVTGELFRLQDDLRDVTRALTSTPGYLPLNVDSILLDKLLRFLGTVGALCDFVQEEADRNHVETLGRQILDFARQQTTIQRYQQEFTRWVLESPRLGEPLPKLWDEWWISSTTTRKVKDNPQA